MLSEKPNCPHYSICPDDHSRSHCPGKLRITRLVTEQVVYSCTETLHIFYGTEVPTNDTPCELTERYFFMLGADLLLPEKTACNKTIRNETKVDADILLPKMEWNVEEFFQRIKEARQSQITRKTTVPENMHSLLCPVCTKSNHHETAVQHMIFANHLTAIKIPATDQTIPFCRACRTIWPENVYPCSNNHGGKLDFYLAMLGLIQFCC